MKKQKRTKDKKVLYILILMFPSLLIAVSAGLELVLGTILRLLLLAYQMVLIKNFMDEYYGE